MCFRPAATGVQFVECSQCGKKVNVVMGNLPKICPFCDADLPPLEEAQGGSQQVSQVPPSAPPISDGGPQAPKAPGAPR